jgi:hypothetical protein
VGKVTVEDLFKRLSYGPLSNLAIGVEGAGSIEASKRPKMISYLNEALLRLHSRFVLIEDELIIKQNEAITTYRISSKFAIANPDADPLAFIQDSIANPYQDDLIKILAVYNATGCKLPLNDVDRCDSVFTPQPNVLQVPKPIQDERLHLIYQARLPEIPLDNDLSAEIDLPPVLNEALMSYISYKVFSHMNGQEHLLKASEYLTSFNNSCSEVEEMDLVNSSSSSSGSKFISRGWK